MDTLHTVMRTIRTEAKSSSEPLNVFREFLRHLDSIQRKAPAKPRAKSTPRRKTPKRTRKG